MACRCGGARGMELQPSKGQGGPYQQDPRKPAVEEGLIMGPPLGSGGGGPHGVGGFVLRVGTRDGRMGMERGASPK